MAVGFAKTGITTVTRSRSSSTLKTSPSQPLYGPPMTRTLSPDCTLIGITSKKTRLLPISAESHQHSPAIGLTIRLSGRRRAGPLKPAVRPLVMTADPRVGHRDRSSALLAPALLAAETRDGAPTD